MGIPRELDDAARLDGCGFFGIYWRIILPLSKPALIVVIIFSFTWYWADFLSPLIYLNEIEKFTVALGLRCFQTREASLLMGPLMAATTVSILPIVILFFFFQRHFIKGISLAGVKK